MASDALPSTVSADCVSVGWICATTLEQSTACYHFDEQLTLSRPHDDDAPFMLDVGLVCGHVVAVVCLVGSEDPLTAAPRAANWLASTFPNIRIRLSVGIGSGSPTFEKDLRLGDVVVSASTDESRRGVLTYDAGSRSEDPVRVRQYFGKPPDNLFRAVMRVHENRKQLAYTKSLDRFLNHAASKLQAPYGQRPSSHSDKLYCARYPHSSLSSACRYCDPREGLIHDRHARTDPTPRVFHGLVASHRDSVRNGRRRESIVRGVHSESGLKIVCLDKTASSLFSHFECLVIRGIADYADAYGTPTWEQWAALTAAAYAKELLASMTAHEHEHAQDRREDVAPFDNVRSAAMPDYPHGAAMPDDQSLKPARSRRSSTSQRRDPSASSAVTCAGCGNRYQRSTLICRDAQACYCWKCDMSRRQAGIGAPRRQPSLAASMQDVSTSTASALGPLTESWPGTPRRGRSPRQSVTATEQSQVSPFSSYGSEKAGKSSSSSKLRHVARMDDEAFRFMGSPDFDDSYERPAELDLEAAMPQSTHGRGREIERPPFVPVHIRAPTPTLASDSSSYNYDRYQDVESNAWFPGFRPGLSVREFRQMMRPRVVFPGDEPTSAVTRLQAPVRRRLFDQPGARRAQVSEEQQRRSFQEPVISPPASTFERQNSFAEIAMRGVDENARLSMEPSPRSANTGLSPRSPNRGASARSPNAVPSSRTDNRQRARQDDNGRSWEVSREQRTTNSGGSGGRQGAGPRDVVLRGLGAAERGERGRERRLSGYREEVRRSQRRRRPPSDEARRVG